ncbi:hypothetical protein K525DRAFT_260567 [Schizophyllum commune Loenen D]|nr:hypothetical protein K525DRAFT_260567 [Schizophyllum commune Loenen D]
MVNLLLFLRYVAFAVFIICNAIIASVAVWNLSLARTVDFGSVAQVDTYLIFVAASGIVLAFTIVFTQLAIPNAVFGRVFSECIWVALYWIMELAGAAAISALGRTMCDSDDLRLTNQSPTIVHDSCASSQVLMGFSWICTLTLMMYLVALVTTTVSHYNEDPQAWHCKIRDYPWTSSETSHNGSSRAPTPSSIEKATLSVPTTQSRHLRPLISVLNRSNTATSSPESIIHPFPLPANSQKLVPAAPAQRAPNGTRETHNRQPSNNSYYSRPVQASMPRASLQMPSYHNPNRPPSPPRDWRSETSSQQQRTTPSPPAVGAGSAASSTASRGSRRVPGHRPPPLDLSKISAFRQR